MLSLSSYSIFVLTKSFLAEGVKVQFVLDSLPLRGWLSSAYQANAVEMGSDNNVNLQRYSLFYLRCSFAHLHQVWNTRLSSLLCTVGHCVGNIRLWSCLDGLLLLLRLMFYPSSFQEICALRSKMCAKKKYTQSNCLSLDFILVDRS